MKLEIEFKVVVGVMIDLEAHNIPSQKKSVKVSMLWRLKLGGYVFVFEKGVAKFLNSS